MVARGLESVPITTKRSVCAFASATSGGDSGGSNRWRRCRSRRRGLAGIRNENPHHHIDHQPRSAEQREYQEEHSDHRGVDVEVLGQAATDASHHALGSTAVQLAGFFHNACPSRCDLQRLCPTYAAVREVRASIDPRGTRVPPVRLLRQPRRRSYERSGPTRRASISDLDAKKCPPQTNLNAVGTVLTKEVGSGLRTHIYAYATKSPCDFLLSRSGT